MWIVKEKIVMTQALVNTNVDTQVARFGTGRYSALKEECFKDALVIFHLTEDQATKLAENIANEVGAIMKNTPVVVKASKADKDQRLTLSEAAKIKYVVMTPAITALRAMQWSNDAMKNGFNRKETQWKPIHSLQEYLDQLV